MMQSPFRFRLLIWIALAALLMVPHCCWSPSGYCQDTSQETAEFPQLSAGPEDEDEPSQDEAADEAPTEEEAIIVEEEPAPPSESPDQTESATDQTESATQPDSAAAPPADPSGGPAAEDGAPADDLGEESSLSLSPLTLAILILALFVVPILIGNFAASRLNMPDHGWRIALVLGTLMAAATVVYLGTIKYGPDLAGGIILIYELADTDQSAEPAEGDEASRERTFDRSTDMPELIAALKERIDPTGTREVVIREYGPAVEIIIPETGPEALNFVKRRLTSLGQLEFRITADPSIPEERRIIDLAETLPPNQKLVRRDGQPVAKWVEYDVTEFGPPEQPDERVVKRPAGDTPEALVLLDQFNVTGDYLSTVNKDIDETGGPAVQFTFDQYGASRFRRLTSANRPNPATGAVRYLGIVLDGRLRSAPSIRSTISSQGQISGGAMTDKEVEFTVGILKAGKLPVALNKTPISEEIISSTIGEETVHKGTFAIGVSLIAVLLFMLLYYRLAGIIACLALAANLLLVLAVMVMIQAAFTLPGLAGLVLTIGMSVDANVLIFERIREEAARGAAFRMAIRNGFSRATTTIVDANLTTLITGVVLYVIGTDALKGFAVTLILGLLMSMFTAIFCSRIIFDILERRRWVDSLNMSRILGETNIDFMSMRWPASICSMIFIAIGLAAVFARGPTLLDIDFTGGTSVTLVLDKGNEMSVADVRNALNSTELADKNLLVVERGESKSRFMINSSVETIDEVKEALKDVFDDKLKAYSFGIEDVGEFEEGGFKGMQATLRINDKPGYEDDGGVSHDSLFDQITSKLKEQGLEGIEPAITNPEYKPGSVARFKKWTVRLGGVEPEVGRGILEEIKAGMESNPMFPMASKIGGRVSGNMKVQALYAILVSFVGIIAYLWLRFQKVIFGLAAVVALIHDVLVTLGAIALSAYIVQSVPFLADIFQIDAFQIGLTIVAAFLTIMGYSLNDTIVIFDRLREVRGKSPNITVEMVNTSVNQTLSRTILTSLTTLIVVLILYVAGGDGIHAFTFALVVGVIAGTYSTVFIATPVLLWLHQYSKTDANGSRASAK
jgi:SecD/SecF fusion protein